jgi:hypothetical protein
MHILWVLGLSLFLSSITLANDKLVGTSAIYRSTEGATVPCRENCLSKHWMVDFFISLGAKIYPSSARIVQASNRLLVSMYQSCDVLKEQREPIPYTSQMLTHPKPACNSPRRFPRYQWGAKTEINQHGEIASTYVERDNRYNTIDCSGFIVSVLRAAGLKINPDENNEINDTNTPILSTAGIRQLGQRDDCFQNVTFTPEEQMGEGDIINWRIGRSQHAILVTRLGDDPFKIKTLDKDKCKLQNMDYTKFDFEVTHSLGNPSLGPVQHHIQALLAVSNEDIRRRFMLLAVNACKAYHKDLSIDTNIDSGRFKILRHAGSLKPNCIATEKPEIKGEACYYQCIKEI